MGYEIGMDRQWGAGAQKAWFMCSLHMNDNMCIHTKLALKVLEIYSRGQLKDNDRARTVLKWLLLFFPVKCVCGSW